MRVLLFSDLHAHAFRPNSDILPSGRNTRLDDSLKILLEIEGLCQEHTVDGVLFAGDMFHTRGILNVRTFNEVCEALARIKMYVDFFGVLVGNHDQSDRQGTVYSTKTFQSFLTVMDQHGWYTLGSNEDELNVYAVPYHGSKEVLLDHIHTRYDSAAPSCFLGHFGISGGKVGSNFVLVSEHEVNLGELQPYLQEFDQMFLGHYHLPQKLLPKVRFLGATHQHNWGDTGQERGCWIWDTHKDCEFSEPGFIPLTSAPRFISIPYDNVISPKVEVEVDNDFVRVVCPPTLTAEQWAEAAQLVLDGGARRVEPWIEVGQTQKLNPNHAKFNPGADFETMIERYVEIYKDYCGELDTTRLVELGQALLKEVA